jgi:membrane-bound lytic murein transglycosylase D
MRSLIVLLSLLILSFSLAYSQNNTSTATTLPRSITENTTKGSRFSDMLGDQDPVSASLQSFDEHFTYKNPSSSRYDTLLYNTGKFRADEVPRYNQSVTQQRLYDLPMVISMDYNVYVQRYIDVYSVQRREQVSRMLGLARVYFPIFEEELDRAGMPMELKYLSVVESALDPHARSRVGATGLWQFMLSTGRLYGLKVDSYVDERKDPVKSTRAALRYLQEAYNEYGDWLLAIAAYNCGPGNVRKAIARSGGKKNFWQIREYLPRETRGYVPAYIAATYVFNYAAEHNIYPTYVDFSFHQDTLHLRRMDITLSEIAKLSNTDVHTLKNLNPELKLDRIPYSARPYVLRVPPQTAQYFASNQRMITMQYGKRRDQYIEPTPHQSVAGTPVRNTHSYDPPAGKKLVYYTVQSGDAVSTIAEKFGVSSRQIAAWNNLRRYRIRAGQRLKIYTSPSQAKQASRTRNVPKATTSRPAGPPPTLRTGYLLHGAFW